MIRFTPLSKIAPIERLKRAYLETLAAPLDGYWKEAIIDPAPHWQMEIEDHLAGYFALDTNGRLLQFYAAPRFAHRADDLFEAVVERQGALTAVVSTAEPAYLAHCLDRQTAVSVHSYLFTNGRFAAPALPAYPNALFRPSTAADLDQLLAFYARNDEQTDGEAIEANFGTMQSYVQNLIAQEQSFALRDDGKIIGIGERRISRAQPPYADMITDLARRRRGIGAFILAQFKSLCDGENLRPICSCAADNIASRKTIEKAGFIASHRLLDMKL